MENLNRFNRLLHKYQDGSCSRSEYLEMIRMIEMRPELFNAIDHRVVKDWEHEHLLGNSNHSFWNQKRKRIFMFASGIAAAIALLIIAMVFWNFQNRTQIIYQTRFGEIKEISLPDGSLLTLNANSTAKWTAQWKKRSMRTIELDGEAFFEVTHIDDPALGSGMPFIVKTKSMNINVLGTSFNVEARRGDASVFLDEGAVELQFANRRINTPMVMRLGEQISYRRDAQKVLKSENQSIHSAAAWKTGVISFQGEQLRDILTKLSDIFGKEFVCKDLYLLEKRMDIGVPYMNWEATMESLELSMDVKIIREGKIYRIMNN